jgi:hypothetical protein
MWHQTEPVEVALIAGNNTIRFEHPATSLTIKDFTLTPIR